MSEDNVITQNMRDYWLISEVLDAGTPTKEAEESDRIDGNGIPSPAILNLFRSKSPAVYVK